MKKGGFVCALVVLCAFTRSAHAIDDAAFFRLFLQDGSSLVSYGEVARVGDRVVLSMPTSGAANAPALQLVNIAADRVDWDRTTRYAESVRATQYLANQAAYDYAFLSAEVAQTLNAVSATTDPVRRLAAVEVARKTLAEWPARHFGYKQDEVRQMLAVLDEAIADLRVRTGSDRFNLSFVATSALPVDLEPLLPVLTPKEAIEQTLVAARLTESPAERMSLLSTALVGLDRDAAALPPEWVATARSVTKRDIDAEIAADHAYNALTDRMVRLAAERARAADVRGIERLIFAIRARDEALGGKRRDTVAALVDSIQAELDAARRLQLERDRWALRLADFRRYSAAISTTLDQFTRMRPLLEDIKALAGSAPESLAVLLRNAAVAVRQLSVITPPEEFQSAHALLLSAAQLADSAGRTRREAALTGSMARAWDASSAAAGSIMLHERARNEVQSLIRLPQLTR